MSNGISQIISEGFIPRINLLRQGFQFNFTPPNVFIPPPNPTPDNPTPDVPTPDVSTNVPNITYSNTFDASDSIINNTRKLNVTLTTSVFYTNNFTFINARKIRLYAINQYFSTIPVFIDTQATPYTLDSARIGDKIYDVSNSGTNNFCLTIYNTYRDPTPLRYVDINNLSLPVNQFGDVILYQPNPSTIQTEIKLFWMQPSLDLFKCAAIGFLSSTNNTLTKYILPPLQDRFAAVKRVGL